VCHHDHAPIVRQAMATNKIAPALATVSPHDFQTRDDTRVLSPRRGDRTAGAEDFLKICSAREGRKPGPISLSPNDLGLLLYTSGTTGRPKGAMISHANLAFNVANSVLWMKLHSGSRIPGLAPLFHITGFVLHTGVAFGVGCSMALQYRVQPELVLDVIREYRPTFAIAAITAFNALMNAPGAVPADFECFKTAFSGGAPIAPVLRQSVKDRLGIDLHPVYGMTESCSPTHVAPLGLEPPVDAASGAMQSACRSLRRTPGSPDLKESSCPLGRRVRSGCAVRRS
jgi:long-chain acyl-CoA synthetase